MELEILIAEIQNLHEAGYSVSEIAWGMNLRKRAVKVALRSV